jgi:hypothetical protein
MQQICPEGQQGVPEALPDALCKAALDELCLVAKQWINTKIEKWGKLNE